MKKRKVGQIEVSIEEMQTIADMTADGSYSRKAIAKAVNRSVSTVWVYQKKLDLI